MLSQSIFGSILNTIGISSQMSLGEMVWAEYSAYTVPKINESAMMLRGAICQVNNSDINEVAEILKALDTFAPKIALLKKRIQKEKSPEVFEFKNSFIYFENTISALMEALEDRLLLEKMMRTEQTPMTVEEFLSSIEL